MLQGGTAIPSGADMNDYTEIGNYYCNANSIAQTLENCPTTSGFTLKVENAVGESSAGSSGYIRQTFTEYDTGRKIVRYRVNSTSTWQPFVYFSDDATVLSKTGIELYGEQVIDAVPSTEYTTVGQINVKEGNNLIMVYAMFNNSRPIGLKLQTTSGVDVAVVESNNLAITLSLFVHVNADVTYNILLKCLFESVSINNVCTSILHFG